MAAAQTQFRPNAVPLTSPESPNAVPPPTPIRNSADPPPAARSRRSRRFALGSLTIVLAGACGAGAWYFLGPRPVSVTRPATAQVTETISATGRASARVESVVGARTSGVIDALYVREGDRVRRGQSIARVSDDVTAAQQRQARQARRTAAAAMAEATVGPMSGETDAAMARVRQAAAQAAAAAADDAQAELALRQAQTAGVRASADVRAAGAAVREAEAQAVLARTTASRYQTLYAEGALPRQSLDEAEAAAIAADARTAAAESSRAAARAGQSAAELGIRAARRAADAARSRTRAAAAAADALAGDARVIALRPRPETVRAARQRVRDADEAVRVATAQAAQAKIYAPYDGTVTAVLAEVGAPVTPGSGVVRLSMTSRPEIKVSVDEDRLPDLHPGLRAVVTSSAFPNVQLESTVSRIAASVDNARGTVEVTVIPSPDAAARGWIRPGQTVNVNLILRESRCLVVPTTAVRRQGDRNIALVVENGRAVVRPVTVGDVEGRLVPVSGLQPQDVVLTDVLAATPGTRVRARQDPGQKAVP